jgi:hypothetical protein
MPGSDHPIPPFPPPLDLDAYSETKRRALYDLTVAIYFASAEDPLPYSPEDAGLVVFWAFDRWYAVWQPVPDPEEGFLPPAFRWTVLRITTEPEAPLGVMFHDC